MPNMGLKLGIYNNYYMMYLQEENEMNWMTWEGGGGGEGVGPKMVQCHFLQSLSSRGGSCTWELLDTFLNT